MTHDDGGGASRTTDPASGSSVATDVSLREYVAEKIKLDRTLIAVVFAFCAFAWSEIQRRLEILNHENARLLAQQEKTVSIDTYTANEEQRKGEQADLKIWRGNVDANVSRSISREEFERDTKVDRRGGISSTTAIIGAVVAVIVVGLGILNYQALHNKPTITPTVTVTVPAP